MRGLIRFLSIVILTASTLPAAETPSIRFSPLEFKAEDGTKVAAEAGELRVRQTHGNDKAPVVTLALVRFKSTAAKPGPPIVYLAGGPGASGIAAARGARFPLFMALRAAGDVIALDQRGTGRSVPSLECEGSYVLDPSAPMTRSGAAQSIRGPLSTCLAGLRAKGVDPSAYNTRESARDLEDLRRALGVPKISLWGISYGTHLALAALKEMPGQIDRVVLAGLEPLDATEKLPSDQQSLLEEIARLAAASHAHEDLLGAIGRLGASLDKTPRVVSLTHPVTMQKVDLTVGRVDLQFVIAQMLTGPETFAALPELVTRLEEGDWTALALASGRFRFGRTPSAMSAAMDCASGASPARRKAIAEEAKTALLGDAVNIPFPEVCADLGIADLGDGFREPARSDVPALLISGTLDGRTPPRNAGSAMKGLTHATHLVVDGAGHSDPLFLGSPKILEAMLQFLRDGATTTTHASAPPVRFIPQRRAVAIGEEALARLAGEYRHEDKSVRTILKAGTILYSVRGKGQPNPIRPSSADEFFFEGVPVTIRFESDEKGKVAGLVFQGSEGPAQRAVRVR